MIAYHSRWFDRDFQKFMICEFCEYKLKNPHDFEKPPRRRAQIRRACDIHHIDWRGGGENRNIDNRMYDPANLIFLCRKCHKEAAPYAEIMKWIVQTKLVHKTYDECIATNPSLEKKQNDNI